MTADQQIYRVQPYAWMRALTPANDPKAVYYAYGLMLDYKRETWAVTRKVAVGAGPNVLYCPEHNYVFGLREEECELCRAQSIETVADATQEAGVTPL